ncbi:MAG: methyltransferase domain-containing protein [Acidiferrobacteraceae bacterium]
MAARDPHRFSNELDEATLESLRTRLEARAQDAVFTTLFDKYIERLALSGSTQILEVGCGTGAMLRLLVRRDDFTGEAYGVDQCHSFITTAEQLAGIEGAGSRLSFQVGDAHHLDFPDASFDVVIAHTLISHVTEPVKVLSEMARVVRPTGAVVIFDGDYASLTYAFADHSFGHQMDAALASATFNNPRIMRDLPRLLPALRLKVSAAWGDAVVEIGNGSYFKSFAETYVPYVKRAGLLPAQRVEVWLNEQRRAMQNGVFFAACNYYTYLARHISG